VTAGVPPGFFHRPADQVARDLLGCRLVSRIGGDCTGGRIIETEAYLGLDDPASHAFGGRRHAGNLSIYGPPGTWYVYRSYGIHWCANLVTAPLGAGAAVLLRGILPDTGLDLMRRRRGAVPDDRLATGPGNLTQALGITRELDGQMVGSALLEVWPARHGEEVGVRVTPRIGISRAVEWPLRFVAEDGVGAGRPTRKGSR